MPTASQHRAKVQKNRDFLASVDLTGHPEWAATTAFYVAVHLVEAMRADLGDGHSANHDDRIRYIRICHPSLFSAFFQLYTTSRLARYETAGDVFKKFPTPEDVTAVVLDTWLAAVDAYASANGAGPD